MSPKLLNILLLSLSGVLYYFVITPLYFGGESIVYSPGENSIKQLLAVKKQYKGTLDGFDSLKAQAVKLKKAYDDYDDTTKKKIMVMVPTSINKLVFLEELGRISDKTGNIEGLDIRDKGGGQYLVSFSISTTYAQFKEAITHWEKSMRLFSLKAVSFSPGKKEEDILKFNVELYTYYLKQ